MISQGLSINDRGHLSIGGCDAVELAEEYGTPLYVMDETTMRDNCRKFTKMLEETYENSLAVFACKAICCKAICKIIEEEGMGLDVVSGGELYTALRSGFPVDKIFFHGNNKTKAELEMALDNEVGKIVVDNIFELELLNSLAAQKGKISEILFRIKPGVEAHTHEFVKTGQIDSKFGIALETGEAMEMVKLASKMENVKLTGIHCHIGSQIFETEPFELAAKVMMEFISDIKNETGIEIEQLNLGGGFGIKYLEGDKHEPYHEFISRVSKEIKDLSVQKELKLPQIIIEPGRAIAGTAGVTLYTVGGIKEIPNVRNYVSVDGGMADNPRYIMYGSPYSITVANKALLPADYTATIAGRCCESGDLIQEHVKIQKPSVGDIIAVLNTGAYNYSMSSRYNRLPNPAVIMTNNGKSRVIVRRETYDDVIRYDV